MAAIQDMIQDAGKLTGTCCDSPCRERMDVMLHTYMLKHEAKAKALKILLDKLGELSKEDEQALSVLNWWSLIREVM